MWEGHPGLIKACSTKLNSERHMTDLLTQSNPAKGPKARDFEKQERNRMLAMDVFEPAQMKWASQTVFVLRNDRNLCICVINRKLNAMAIQVRARYHLWTNVLIPLARQQCFRHWRLIADISKSISQRKIEVKNAFTAYHGLYHSTCMLFGLRNAPETFPRAMEVILKKVKSQFAVVYFDDIVILFWLMQNDRIEHVPEVLTLS